MARSSAGKPDPLRRLKRCWLDITMVSIYEEGRNAMFVESLVHWPEHPTTTVKTKGWFSNREALQIMDAYLRDLPGVPHRVPIPGGYAVFRPELHTFFTICVGHARDHMPGPPSHVGGDLGLPAAVAREIMSWLALEPYCRTVQDLPD